MAIQSVTQTADQAIAGVIEVRQSKPMVSSLKIAELFDRRHDNVLSAIRRLPVSSEFFLSNFKETSGFDSQGKARPVYYMTEEGKEELLSKSLRYTPKNGQPGLYVILFSTGVVKVGKSYDPSRRIEQHKTEAAKYGVVIISSFFVKQAQTTEKELIDFASKNSDQYSGKEYFIGADFDTIKAWLASHGTAQKPTPKKSTVASNPQQMNLFIEVAA